MHSLVSSIASSPFGPGRTPPRLRALISSTAWVLGLVVMLLGPGDASPALAQAVIGSDQAHRLQTAGMGTLIDVRTPQERAQGYPVGSVAIPWTGDEKTFAAEVLALVNGNRAAPLMLICRSGNRSARAASALVRQGFTSVTDVADGFSGGGQGPGWRNRGLPVEGAR